MRAAALSGDIRTRLDAIIHQQMPTQVPLMVKAVLIDSMQNGALDVPARLRVPRPDTYARRLLHRDPAGHYTMVVMTWGPQQRTALHDHSGMWCVECVVDGSMEVTQYDLLSEQAGAYRFERRSSIVAGRGTAGCLIPPFEYHTLGNAAAAPSVTLHVYGGEMDHCHIYQPAGDGSYRRVRKALAYHD